jgi:predicted Zn-dependent protease
MSGICAAQTKDAPVDPLNRDTEMEIGKQMAEDARRRWPVVENPVLQKYVERVAATLGRQFRGSAFPYRFTIVDDRLSQVMTEEPLAFPAGYIFVRTGLFLSAQNEAEFAGMLAHAMAHVSGRHSARSMAQSQKDNLTEKSVRSGGAPVPIKYAEAAREYELEADKTAMKMLSDAGYPPIALLNYIDRTQQDPIPLSLSSPMPSREARLNLLREALKPLMGRAFPSVAEFLRMQDEVKRLRFSPDRTASLGQ